MQVSCRSSWFTLFLVKKICELVFACNPCLGEGKQSTKGNEFVHVSIPLLRVSIAETKSADEIERLVEEYESLARRQYEALQRCPYALLSRREAALYEARFVRIQEISREIVRLRSEAA